MSTFITLAEQAGAMVDADLMDRTVAIGMVYAAADGALTLEGAAEAVDRWQDVRREAADMLMEVEQAIAVCQSAQAARVVPDMTGFLASARERHRAHLLWWLKNCPSVEGAS